MTECQHDEFVETGDVLHKTASVSSGRWGIIAWSYCKGWEFLVNGRDLCNCSYGRLRVAQLKNGLG